MSPLPLPARVGTRTAPSSRAYREEGVYEFGELDLGSSQDFLTLRAGRRSCFDKISSAAKSPDDLPVRFIPRTPLSHFTDLGQGDLFDVKAFVLPGDRSRALVCIDARTEMIDASVPSFSYRSTHLPRCRISGPIRSGLRQICIWLPSVQRMQRS